MRRWAVVLSAFTISLGAATTVAGTAVADPPDNDPYTLSDGHANAGMGGVVIPRGDSHSNRPGGGGSPLLSYHGGGILSSTVVQAIFWGRNWSNSSFVDDKVSGIDTFYSGVGGSAYLNSNTEYTNSAGTHVGTAVSYQGHLVDTTSAPSGAPQTSAIQAEVSKEITAPVANGYYPVYVDTPRGRTGYCAWHSYGTVHGVPVQFGFFFNLDGDPGCDPGTYPGQWQHQGLAALGNVSGHELSETVTDPGLLSWYDQQGSENADKCAWTFSGTVQLGSSIWKVQGNWSNNAYNKVNGYVAYGSGGCIETH